MWFGGSCGKNHYWKVNYYMFNTKEHVFYEDLGKSHAGVITLNCPNHRSQIMMMERWPLSQTILDGHCLSLFATSMNIMFQKMRKELLVWNIYVCEKKTKGFKWGFQCSYQMNTWTWAMNFEREQWTCELDFDEQQGIFYE